MKKFLYIFLSFFLFQNILFAQPSFPELTGRVVDKAKLFSQNQKNELISLLENHEKQTSNQVVIVTLNSLKGYDIADYGYQLGRYWKIGQEKKNNGVLLIVSIKEKKIRIEVGYGLEGALTDKISHEIIEYIIKPKFRQADYYQGIYQGAKAVIDTIKGEYKPENYNIPKEETMNWFFLYFAIIFLSPVLASFGKAFKSNTLFKIFHSSMLGGFAGAFAIAFFNSLILSALAFFIITIIIFFTTKKVSYDSYTSSHSTHTGGFGGFSGSSSGGFSGGFGGFSGGGGSFGGGGASGGW